MTYYESFFADRTVGDERERVLKNDFFHFLDRGGSESRLI